MATEDNSHTVFIAYSHKDKEFLDELKTVAVPLEKRGKIKIWYDGKIEAGKTWDYEIRKNLQEADVIMLLISAYSLASDYFYDTEVAEALVRHRNNEARVIPVILSGCFWQETPLGDIQVLPREAIPVNKWTNQHEAWYEVLESVLRSIEGLQAFRRSERERLDREEKIRREKKRLFIVNLDKADELFYKKKWVAAMDIYRTLLHQLEPESPEEMEVRIKDRISLCKDYISSDRTHQIAIKLEIDKKEKELRADFDRLAWEFAEAGGKIDFYEKYLNKFPEGIHCNEALKRIRELGYTWKNRIMFSKDHEWIRLENDKIALIGISDFAQGELGEMVYIEVNTEGEMLNPGDTFGTLEAIKTTSDLLMPVTARVLEFNPLLNDALGGNPSIVNDDPYGNGWIIKVEVTNPADLDTLMSADLYKEYVGA